LPSNPVFVSPFLVIPPLFAVSRLSFEKLFHSVINTTCLSRIMEMYYLSRFSGSVSS
jgi:hypothetical protein